MRLTLLAVSLLALGVAIEGAAAQDEGPVKIGVLTDMNSLCAGGCPLLKAAAQ